MQFFVDSFVHGGHFEFILFSFQATEIAIQSWLMIMIIINNNCLYFHWKFFIKFWILTNRKKYSFYTSKNIIFCLKKNIFLKFAKIVQFSSHCFYNYNSIKKLKIILVNNSGNKLLIKTVNNDLLLR